MGLGSGIVWNFLRHITWPAILVTASTTGVTLIIYRQLIKPFFSPLRKIPGLPYRPFSLRGNMNVLMKGQSMEATIKYFREYGPIMRYYFFFGSERVSVGDPAILRHILVTNSHNYIKPPERVRMMESVLGRGLITSSEPEHTMHKKLISPSFNQASINKMIPTFVEKTEMLVDYWEKIILSEENAKCKDLPVHSDMAHLTLDVIGKTAFGYDFNCLENPGSENNIAASVERLLTGREFSWRMFLPFYEYLPLREVYQFKSDLANLDRIIYDVIDDKRQKLQQKGDDDSVSRDVLGMMMLAEDESGHGLTNVELRDQVITLMFAGHETTAVAMAWCLLLLAQHPEMQQKAREEAQHLAPEGATITVETLEKLKYIILVIKETLRLYPPVPMTARQTVHDDRLGSYYVPKGTTVILAFGAMMRLEENYKDPEEFIPDRFTTDEGKNFYKFLPFLLGSRMCVGYKFALQEMKVMLLALLRKFNFSQVPDTEYIRKLRITMRPYPALHLRVSLASHGK